MREFIKILRRPRRSLATQQQGVNPGDCIVPNELCMKRIAIGIEFSEIGIRWSRVKPAAECERRCH